MAPVLRAFVHDSTYVESLICVTAQHRELLDQALNDFAILPHFDLNSMERGQDLVDSFSRIMGRVGHVLEKASPDVVLVQGDTTSTLAATLAAAYRRVPVGHIEAGLRTHDPLVPFPEEMNRRAVDHLATFCFAPTPLAAENLLKEGIPPDRIFVTGNTGIDALLLVLVDETRSRPRPRGPRTLLVTCHRRESFGHAIRAVCEAVGRITLANPDVHVLYVLHPNPEAGAVAYRLLAGTPRVELIPPLSYPELVREMATSYLILTDSGGIQEEAPVLGKPVLVLRERTERAEGLEAGVARLIGTDTEVIAAETQRLLNDEVLYRRMSRPLALYGDGRAAARISGWLRHLAGLSAERPDPFTPGLLQPATISGGA